VLSFCFATIFCLGCGPDTAEEKNGVRVRAASAPGGSYDASGSTTASVTGERGTGSADSPASHWPPGLLDITFDDIKFDMEKGESFVRGMFTEPIEQLEERDVRIRGYILPSFRQRGITQFVLVRDNMECCFGPGAALFDCILVEMEPGKSTSFTIRPVTVEGTFAIREFKGPDGTHLAIYHMSGRKVK
jgi:hypothetical protein